MTQMSSNYESARDALLSINGVTGVSQQGRDSIIVYVLDNSVNVPNAIYGFTVQKKVSGNVKLQK